MRWSKERPNYHEIRNGVHTQESRNESKRRHRKEGELEKENHTKLIKTFQKHAEN